MNIEEKREEILLFLRTKIAELVEVPDRALQAGEDQDIKDIGLDSVMFVNTIIHIEKHFDIVFEDDELVIDHFATLKLIADSILGKLKQQGGILT